MANCAICNTEIKRMNKPFFGHGSLNDGNEICTECHGDIDMEDVRKFSSAEVKLIFLGEKSPGEIVKDKLRSEMGLDSEPTQEPTQEPTAEQRQNPAISEKKSFFGKVWKTYWEGDAQVKKTFNWIFAIILTVIIGGVYTLYDEVTMIDSVDKAKEYAPGIWTGSIYYGGDTFWRKYVINKNGTYESYVGMAVQDDWGDIEYKGTWSTGSSKYIDTGDRYYYVEFVRNTDVGSWADIAPIKRNQLRIKSAGGNNSTNLSKKDAFPFKE